MVVDDEGRAKHYLGHLNYYRLRGYWMHLELPNGNGEHSFVQGTSFDQIISLYDFDRHLRLLANDAIERVEVSLRTRWAYVLGHKAGPTAHLESKLFNEHHSALLAGVERLYADRKEIYLRHYLDRNEEPPIWALCEAFSLGDLSKWLRAIKDRKVRQEIANPYGLHETPFCSFVQQLAFVRNLCAHHGRLWNKKLIVGEAALPKKPASLVDQLQRDPDRYLRVHNVLAMLAWLMQVISPHSGWSHRVREHVEARPDLWEDMGFPPNWQSFELWQRVAP